MMEATAIYNFDGSQSDELSFKQGDMVKILNIEDRDWYQAEINGRCGYVPSSYVQMETFDWYMGKMSREDAEIFLAQKLAGRREYQDGAFVIRDCQRGQNQFSLTVKHGNNPQHFKIMSTPQGMYYLWPDKTFLSVNRLIDYYRSVSVSRTPPLNIILKELQPARQVEQTRLYEAKYPFISQSREEVSFEKGDHIEFLEETDINWWTGRVLNTNVRGLFPKTYVKKI